MKMGSKRVVCFEMMRWPASALGFAKQQCTCINCMKMREIAVVSLHCNLQQWPQISVFNCFCWLCLFTVSFAIIKISAEEAYKASNT